MTIWNVSSISHDLVFALDRVVLSHDFDSSDCEIPMDAMEAPAVLGRTEPSRNERRLAANDCIVCLDTHESLEDTRAADATAFGGSQGISLEVVFIFQTVLGVSD